MTPHQLEMDGSLGSAIFRIMISTVRLNWISFKIQSIFSVWINFIPMTSRRLWVGLWVPKHPMRIMRMKLSFNGTINVLRFTLWSMQDIFWVPKGWLWWEKNILMEFLVFVQGFFVQVNTCCQLVSQIT